MEDNGHVISIGLDCGQISQGGMELSNEGVHDQGNKEWGRRAPLPDPRVNSEAWNPLKASLPEMLVVLVEHL